MCEFGLMSSGTGDIALGDSFLRSAYVVYDLTNKQIGLAQTVFNETLSNIVEIDSGIPYASATATAMATQTHTETVTKTETAQFANEPGSPTFTLSGLNANATSSTSASHATVSNQPNHSMTHSAKLGIGLGVPFGMVVITGIILYSEVSVILMAISWIISREEYRESWVRVLRIDGGEDLGAVSVREAF